jgi:tetratricopeptide (TPR) repeat protein
MVSRFAGLMKNLLHCVICAALLVMVACEAKQSGVSPDEQIREGWAQYRLGEFQKAVHIFASMQATQPKESDYYLQALYGEASCWNHRRERRDTEKAIAGYRAVIDQAPQHPLAAWCALDIVRTRHLAPADQEINYEQLIRDYTEVYRKYSNTLAGEEAFLYASSLPLPTADVPRARAILAGVETFLTTHPQSVFLSEFYSIIAECYRKMDDQDRRIEYMIKSLNTREVDPSNPMADRSTTYWNIAYAAEFEAGNFALAREYYNRLMCEYPQDVRVFGVRRAFERMDAVEAALREGRNPMPDWAEGIPVAHQANCEELDSLKSGDGPAK